VTSSTSSSTPPAEDKTEEHESLIDIEALKELWSLQRASRLANNEKKIRSLEDGPLRGGDFVLNKDSEAASHTYKSNKFGLTVGHLSRQVGDPIFAFAKSNPTATHGPYPTSLDDNSTVDGMSLYHRFKIGKVISRLSNTNSVSYK
jgi:hypothetical protein